MGSKEADRPGLVTVKDGRLLVTEPKGDGEWPVITPGKNVRVLVNGEPIEERYRLQPGDQVEIEPDSSPPGADVNINKSQDGLTATAQIVRKPGYRYKLTDVPPASFLVINAFQKEIIPPPELTVEHVKEALSRANVTFGIDEEAIARLVADPDCGRAVVARGVPPRPPVDGEIRYHVSEKRRKQFDPEAVRVDYFDLMEISWVQEGDLLAERVPPKEGAAGKDVSGRELKPRKPKDVRLVPGEGADFGTTQDQLVATRGGRPEVSGDGRISVVPVHLLHGDADASTGHIKFQANVIVDGNVNESIEIRAGGCVQVSGIVSYALIEADGDVTVKKNVISSRIQAGGQSALAARFVPALRLIMEDLQELVAAVEQLKTELASRLPAVGVRSDGQLVKHLLEMKMKRLPGRVEELAAQLKSERTAIDMLAPEAVETVEEARRMLTGRGPLDITQLEELRGLIASMAQLLERLESVADMRANAVLLNAQNSRVRASGHIVITGKACYNSELVAGEGIVGKRAICRGGVLMVNEGSILFRELGGPTGAPTSVCIAHTGQITAGLAHPGVTLEIAGQRASIDEPIRGLKAFIKGGVLEVAGHGQVS